jgi:hypothetical protein
MQSRGDRLTGLAEADKSDSRVAVGHALLVDVLGCAAMVAIRCTDRCRK